MTLRIQFDFDKKSAHWSDDVKWRSYYCDNTIDYLKSRYRLGGYISLIEICERFGVPCPIEWRCIVFNYKDDAFIIDYEDFGDLVSVFCTYES